MTLTNTQLKQHIRKAATGSLKDLGEALDAVADGDDLYVGGVQVTATAAEINAAADVSGRAEVVTATNVLTAAESGKTFFLHALAGFLTTLPAPALGLEFNFIVKTAPTSNGYTFAPSGGTADIIVIGVNELEVDTADDGPYDDNADLVTLVANVAVVGDFLHFWCDGTKWYARGQTNADGGITSATT